MEPTVSLGPPPHTREERTPQPNRGVRIGIVGCVLAVGAQVPELLHPAYRGNGYQHYPVFGRVAAVVIAVVVVGMVVPASLSAIRHGARTRNASAIFLGAMGLLTTAGPIAATAFLFLLIQRVFHVRFFSR
jgi:hypothetical protein